MNNDVPILVSQLRLVNMCEEGSEGPQIHRVGMDKFLELLLNVFVISIL